jgi:hypothetical protein
MNEVFAFLYIIIALVAVGLIMLMPVKVLLKEGLKKEPDWQYCCFGLLLIYDGILG